MRFVFDVTKYVNEATSVVFGAFAKARNKKSKWVGSFSSSPSSSSSSLVVACLCVSVVKHQRGNAWADTVIHFVGCL